jgi:hypothetical protein
MRRSRIAGPSDYVYRWNYGPPPPVETPPKVADKPYEGQVPIGGADPLQLPRAELLRRQREQGKLGRKGNGRT